MPRIRLELRDDDPKSARKKLLAIFERLETHSATAMVPIEVCVTPCPGVHHVTAQAVDDEVADLVQMAFVEFGDVARLP